MSHSISPEWPVTRWTIEASSLIVIDVPVPTLTCPLTLSCPSMKRQASASSSVCRNSLFGAPVPQHVTVLSGRCSWNRRIKAAMTCECSG